MLLLLSNFIQWTEILMQSISVFQVKFICVKFFFFVGDCAEPHAE